MSKFAKLKTLAAASAAVAAALSATPAQAYVYAVSHLDVTNLNIITLKSDNTAYIAPVASYTFNQSNNASINSIQSSSTAACGNPGTPCSIASPVLDAAAVNAPGSTLLRSNNTFALLGANNTDTYSNADSSLDTARIVQNLPTSLRSVSESLLNTNGIADAATSQQSNTSLSMVYDLTDKTNLYVGFEALLNMLVDINGPQGTYLGQADVNVSLTATHKDGARVTWTPDGDTFGCILNSKAAVAGITCDGETDTGNLNGSASTGDNPDLDDQSFSKRGFQVFMNNLIAGNWTLALSAKTSTSIVRAVPEPDSLALLGAALAGLAFATRRRSQKQQH